MVKTDITISHAECQAQQLSMEHIAEAQQALRTEGYVILRQAVQAKVLDALEGRMLEDLDRLLALASRQTPPYNWVKGHVTVQPPPMHPYLFTEILANPFACAVSTAVHRKFFNSTYMGLAIMPGTPAQPLHADHGQLWPDLKEAHPPVSLIVNTPITDVNEENGAIELWPGTHLDTSIWKGDAIEVSAAATTARREICPPIRACTSQGDLLMRDMRLWHRGMPNDSDAPRIMLVNSHHIFWRDRSEKIKIPSSAQAFFDELPIETVYEIQPDDWDYLIQHEPYGYTPGRHYFMEKE